MTAAERLAKLLDQKDREILDLRGRIEDLERSLRGVVNGWRVGEVLPDEQTLPVPRLEMVWREVDGWFDCVALYRLVYRHFQGHIVSVPIGNTRRQGGHGEPPIRDGEVDTPFRDGAHICHDAAHLGLPAFAVCGDVVTPLPSEERVGRKVTDSDVKPGSCW